MSCATWFAFAGFKEQIYDVYRYLPPATQVVLISATLPHEILEMTNKFMTDPIRILVKRWVFLECERDSSPFSPVQFDSVFADVLVSHFQAAADLSDLIPIQFCLLLLNLSPPSLHTVQSLLEIHLSGLPDSCAPPEASSINLLLYSMARKLKADSGGRAYIWHCHRCYWTHQEPRRVSRQPG